MKTYPSISHKIQYGVCAYVFNKIDGSNIRVEWQRKQGFCKFGSRKRLLGSDQGVLTEAESLMKNNFESELSDIFKKQRYEKVTCFFEFIGKNSFAGRHEDEEHELVLIDVAVYKKGILLPQDFLKLFGHLNVAKLLYHGNVTHDLVDSIRNGELEGMGEEGVVCKSSPLKKGFPPNMFKVKTKYWLDKLKNYCKGDEKLFEKLK